DLRLRRVVERLVRLVYERIEGRVLEVENEPASGTGRALEEFFRRHCCLPYAGASGRYGSTPSRQGARSARQAEGTLRGILQRTNNRISCASCAPVAHENSRLHRTSRS